MKKQEYDFVKDNKARLNKLFVDLVENKKSRSRPTDFISCNDERLLFMKIC